MLITSGPVMLLAQRDEDGFGWPMLLFYFLTDVVDNEIQPISTCAYAREEHVDVQRKTNSKT